MGVWRKAAAPMRFIGGALVGALFFPLAVNLPGVVALLFSAAIRASDALFLASLIAGGLVSIMLCAAVGFALGRASRVSRPFVFGMALGSLLEAAQGAMRSTHWDQTVVGSLTCVAAGIALLFGYYAGRSRVTTSVSSPA